MLGDPHIITLDGHKYTFNGNGEFVLIQTPDDKFTLQGRMVPAEDTNGSSVLATVFSAIVGKQADSDTVQFELTQNGTTAFVNGEPLDFSDLSEQEFNNVAVTDLGNNTLSATFSSGVYLEVKEENGILSVIIISLPESFKDVPTTGLMGSFNGNATDDLLPNLGTNPLPLNSSLQEIHELFGLTCKSCDLEYWLFLYISIMESVEVFLVLPYCTLQGSLIRQLTVSLPTNLVKAGPLTTTHTLFQPTSQNSLIQTWQLKQMNSVATILFVFLT